MRAVLSLMWAGGVALVVVVVTSTMQPTEAATPGSVVERPYDDGDPINGRKVYLRENCYVCHGGRVGGGMCPSFRDDPPDESDIRDAVEEGTESGMPAYGNRITRREIEDIAAYFETLRTVREPTFTHWWEPGTPSR